MVPLLFSFISYWYHNNKDKKCKLLYIQHSKPIKSKTNCKRERERGGLQNEVPSNLRTVSLRGSWGSLLYEKLLRERLSMSNNGDRIAQDNDPFLLNETLGWKSSSCSIKCIIVVLTEIRCWSRFVVHQSMIDGWFLVYSWGDSLMKSQG